MRVKIYQVNTDRDKNKVRFTSKSDLTGFQGSDTVDSSAYDEVFNADIDETDLESIYRIFNTEYHPLFRGRSMSVSDVVVMGDTAYYCDRIGFKKIDFDLSKTQKPDNLMRIVYVEPHKAPYTAEIENTLKAKQKAVGGLIEPVYNGDETCLIGNEESKLLGLEGNRYIFDGQDIIAGPFFVCGVVGENFRGLTDGEVAKYMDVFACPEDISQEEVNGTMGFQIYGC